MTANSKLSFLGRCWPGPSDGLHRLDEESIRKLKAQANEWDEHIGSLFANYRQDYTFAPKEAG
jgi:hypothetical protein